MASRTKKEKRRKKFKAKTRKGNLNHTKKKKGQVENLKRRLDQGEVPRLKTRKGGLEQ